MSNFPDSASQLPPHPSEKPNTSGDSSPPLRPSRWVARIIFVLVIVGLLGVLAYNEAPREMARLHNAWATEQFYKGELDQALETVNRGLDWNDEDPDLYFLRARVQNERREFLDALKDADLALKLGVTDQLQLYWLRSEIHQRLDQHEAALEDWRLAQDPAQAAGVYNEDTWLNGTAYVRAVGDFDLDAALNDVEQAIEQFGGDFNVAQRGGVLLLEVGDPKQAVRLFSQALDMTAQDAKRVEKQLETAREARDFLGEFVDPTSLEQQADVIDTRLARLHFYRSRAEKAAGDAEQAKQDLDQAGSKQQRKAWDDELAALSEQDFVGLSGDAIGYAAYIDTRGYLRYRLGDNEAALRDLTTAVDLAEAGNNYFRHSAYYQGLLGYPTSPDEARYKQHKSDMSLAVLHYHRALALEALGRNDEAEAELDRVRELGFEPGPELF